ncbi:MAG: succinate--CoA ligase subunit beta [Actinobacteria bacterium]|nr:MAG: succinate--CoA ligase subunit beta [Actinomycetota bacterium]
MDLYEHQGKELFAKHDIPLVEGSVAESAEQARGIAERLGGKVAVKVQVQIGGRGKGGGIALVGSPQEAEDAAARMLSEGFEGTKVTRVLVERLVDISEQFYAAISLDRSAGAYLAIVSSEGGMDIEQVARERPEALRRVHIDPLLGLHAYQVRYAVGHLSSEAREGAAAVLAKMHEVLATNDATLVEINPLALLTDGRVVALDSKVTIDDNALWRHPELEGLRATFPIDPVEAHGAGLVMATLDVVELAGAKPANFLDVGGGASAEVMAVSLEVILSDPSVRSVLVNIFGGITRCDVVAQGILEALERVVPTVQIVVRLDGTNAPEGRAILAEANHPRIVPAETMLEAAQRAAELARAA